MPGLYDQHVSAGTPSIEEIRTSAVDAFRRFDPDRIILFGSHAAGTADEDSDIDLIVVYDTRERFLDRLRELYVAWTFPKSADILAYTPQEFEDLLASRHFVQDAVAAGTVLYERS